VAEEAAQGIFDLEKKLGRTIFKRTKSIKETLAALENLEVNNPDLADNWSKWQQLIMRPITTLINPRPSGLRKRSGS